MTTVEWWRNLLKDETRLQSWLVRLFHNEKDAYHRFNNFSIQYCTMQSEEWHLFKFLALQELRHSDMVLDLLNKMGIDNIDKVPNDERYWSKVLPCVVDLPTAAGVGSLAEALSYERMVIICQQPETPPALKDLFSKILPDEKIHTKVLAVLAGKHGIDQVIDCHTAGLEALGLKLKAERKE